MDAVLNSGVQEKRFKIRSAHNDDRRSAEGNLRPRQECPDIAGNLVDLGYSRLLQKNEF